jgi:hypothetical protein
MPVPCDALPGLRFAGVIKLETLAIGFYGYE